MIASGDLSALALVHDANAGGLNVNFSVCGVSCMILGTDGGCGVPTGVSTVNVLLCNDSP